MRVGLLLLMACVMAAEQIGDCAKADYQVSEKSKVILSGPGKAESGTAAFVLPPLPWDAGSLTPHISKETVDYHYGKHHAGYVTKLNAAAEADSSIAGQSLEELIKTSSGKVYNLAAQIWNHSFYWNCLSPNGGGLPTGQLAEMISRDFGSFFEFQAQFNAVAAGHFGSGWAWLVLNDVGTLEVIGTHDAANPLSEGKTPILTCDVWEHAYYIDYRNSRADYISAFWELVNWEYVADQL